MKNENMFGKTHCSDVINGLESVSDVDLIVTSPPYNLSIDYSEGTNGGDSLPYDEYLLWAKAWLSASYSALKSGGRICINIPMETNLGGKKFISSDYIQIMQDVGYEKMAFIVWDKRNLTSRTAWGSWMSPSCPVANNPLEVILVFAKDTRKHVGNKELADISREEFIEYTLAVWNFSPAKKSKVGHPAPFPEELPYRCMKLYSYKDDVVVDPFSGSGTTQRVAKNIGRKFIGFDISQEYCDMANSE